MLFLSLFPCLSTSLLLLLATATAASPERAWPSSASLQSDTGLEPEDICKHCYCHRYTVLCDFGRNRTLSPIWNSKYLVPRSITGMELQLTDQTHLQLHGGLFNNNRVNRFVVKGVNGNDQVELSHHAFGGNLGGYPDIQILGVSNVFLGEHAFSGGEIKLRVENSDMLVLFPSAFINMNMSCSFTNISSLKIREKAFNPSTDRSAKAYVTLHIERSNIDRIDSFDVSMNKIMFINCSIGTIQSQAFDVTNINELIFEDCRIKKIEKLAFTSKLHSEHVSITGTQIGTIDKEAIMGSGISKLTLKQNTIDTIKEEAIQVYSVYVYIERNEITNQGKNWLHVMNGELVAIEDNRFANFAAIKLDQSKRSNCSFANNWLGNPQPNSLNFSNCEVRAIRLDRVCSCDDNKNWLPTLTEHDLSSELYCQLGERLQGCFNASTVHLRRYANEACGINRTTLRCADASTLEWYKGEFYSKEEREEQQRGTSNLTIIGFGFLSIVVGLLIVGLVIMVILKFRTHTKEEYCSLPTEACDILRRDVSRMQAEHRGTDLKKYVKKLTSGKLNASQCANTITQVMQDTDQLPQTSNKVLADHLHQAHTTSQSSTTITATHTLIYPRSGDNTLPSAPTESENIDHVYAVPLLCNGYSTPSDPTPVPIYVEPFDPANVNDMPPAYEAMPQYATPLRQPPPPSTQQQLPSTSAVQRRYQELPDVAYHHRQPSTNSTNSASYATPVWRSTPSATPISVGQDIGVGVGGGAAAASTTAQRHVRDLRQDLEAMPQFHPNQLSSARNQSQLQSRFASNPRRTHCSNNNSNNTASSSNNNNNFKRSFECLDGAASLAAMEHMDMRGAAALPPDSGSDHSGGSDETVKIDDVIEYADA